MGVLVVKLGRLFDERLIFRIFSCLFPAIRLQKGGGNGSFAFDG
jgi:hypothetical protein